MLDREDMNSEYELERFQGLRESLSEKDREYLKEKGIAIGTEKENVNIQSGCIKEIIKKSNGYMKAFWVKTKENVEIYIGSLYRFNRLKIKLGEEVHFKNIHGEYVVCNESGDIFTI